MGRELERLVKERTSRLTAGFADCSESLDLVLQENQGLRSSLLEANATIEALRTSAAEQLGSAEEIRSQHEELFAHLRASEREGEEAKKELALTRERLLHSEEKCAQCAKAGAEAAAELSASRDAVSAAHRTLEALRQDLIAAQAELDVTRRSEAAWKEFAADGERLRKELQELSGRVAAAEAERRGLADRLDDANRARSHAEASANRLLEKLLNEEGSRMTMRDEGMNPDNPGNPDRAARSRPAGGRAEV